MLEYYIIPQLGDSMKLEVSTLASSTLKYVQWTKARHIALGDGPQPILPKLHGKIVLIILL